MYSLICSCFFFFSSRRRHTRYIGDWSSDVCSSDLLPRNVADHEAQPFTPQIEEVVVIPADLLGLAANSCVFQRSEERRVGKECRGRGWGAGYREQVSGC